MSTIGEIICVQKPQEEVWTLKYKTLGRVATEASALGMTYGAYVNAVENGTIEAFLRQYEIRDGPERIRKAWAQIKKDGD